MSQSDTEKFYKIQVYIDDYIDYNNQRYFILKNFFGQLKIVTKNELEEWIR